jgi:LacI family transcriptional regulator
MKRRPQVALVIETSNAYARGLLEGITSYIREPGPWSVYFSEHGRGDSVPHWLRGWNGDGILARIENKRIARVVAERRLPTVDLSAAGLVPGLPWVETDDEAIARLAVEHLMGRGFRRLGFCGLTGYRWSIWRCEHFQRIAREAGCECHVHLSSHRGASAADWAAAQRELARWVQRLPRPVGVLACFDIHGRQCLDACRRVGVRVPDDVAVVGVDNDSILCELAEPALSSVAPDTRRTGYLAAGLLDQMMSGRCVASGVHLIRPIGLVARRSTDALAIDDPDVSTAVRFIRENACLGIDVTHVLRAVPLSRRVLEGRFRRLLGRTPHQEIMRCRIEHIKELLRATDLPLKAIAARVGIPHLEYLSVAFKRALGQTPTAYRREFRRKLETTD